MAVARPTTTGLTGPTGRTTGRINEMKLSLLTVWVIGEKAAQHAIGIRTLLKPLKSADPEIDEPSGVTFRVYSMWISFLLVVGAFSRLQLRENRTLGLWSRRECDG